MVNALYCFVDELVPDGCTLGQLSKNLNVIDEIRKGCIGKMLISIASGVLHSGNSVEL